MKLKVGKLCTSIIGDRADTMLDQARKAISMGSDLIEFRLDYLRDFSIEELPRLFSPFAERCILAARSRDQGGRFGGNESERLDLLLRASAIRPRYVDIELNTIKNKTKAVSAVRKNCRRLIVSWHDFDSTPSATALRTIRKESEGLGDITKIVTTAKTIEDNARVLSLYKMSRNPSSLVAFCMGESGTISRILSLVAGSPLTYVTIDRPVAPGQLRLQTVRELLRAIG